MGCVGSASFRGSSNTETTEWTKRSTLTLTNDGPRGTDRSTTTAETTTNRGRIRIETGAKRVRAYLGGSVVADTMRPLLVWEGPHYPTYYFPIQDIKAELLAADDAGIAHSPSRGDGLRLTVRAGAKDAYAAAVRYVDSPIEPLRDAIRLDWDAMDAWFEEDEEVFTHARNPYTRVDILPSSRHVRVEVDGVTIAESSNARLLFETGLRTRYYLPTTHVRMDLRRPTESVTHCPLGSGSRATPRSVYRATSRSTDFWEHRRCDRRVRCEVGAPLAGCGAWSPPRATLASAGASTAMGASVLNSALRGIAGAPSRNIPAAGVVLGLAVLVPTIRHAIRSTATLASRDVHTAVHGAEARYGHHPATSVAADRTAGP